MSVMQRNAYGGTVTGQPMGVEPVDTMQLQRQAIVDQLGTAPTAQAPGQAFGAFQRGGQVKQLPTSSTAGQVGKTGAGAAGQIGNKLAGVSATGAAANAGIGIGANLLADKIRTKEEQPTFGGEFGDITDAYGRRFQTTGGGAKAGAVRGAAVGANPALIAATGGLSIAAGAGIGAAIAKAKQHAPSAYSDFRVEDAADAINKEYQQALGRPASPEEIQTHLVNVGWDPKGGDRWTGEKSLNYILGTIKNSPEAQAYRTRGAVVDQLGTGAAPGAVQSDVDPATLRHASDPTTPYQTPAPGDVGPTVTFADGSTMPLTNKQNEDTLAAQPANTLHWTGVGGAAAAPGAPTASATGGGAPFRPPTNGEGYDGSGINPTPGGIRPAEGAAPGGPGGASVPANADTDGYAAPQFSAPAGKFGLPGFEDSKMSDPNIQHPKYVWGRIAAANMQDGKLNVPAAAAQLVQAYPGATFDGKDKVTIPGVGTIDVVRGASAGINAPTWAPVDDGGGGSAGAAGAPKVDAARTLDTSGGGSDVMAQLQARLQEILAGSPNRDALLAQMGPGANG